MRETIMKNFGAFRAFVVAAVFTLCSGVTHAATLDVSFDISNSSGVTAAELYLVSSTVSDFTNYSGTLISCTSCGPPTHASGQLDDGAGTDSTIVTTGTDGATFDLVFGNFNGANATTVTLVNGAVTSISWSDYLFATNDNHNCGNCIHTLGSDGTELAVYNGVPGPVEADLTLPTPSATPLPATLPLFATGLGALGLLGWRRKRKNTAIAA